MARDRRLLAMLSPPAARVTKAIGWNGRRRCPVCGHPVLAGDAVGLVESRISHAECALVRWLGPAEAHLDVEIEGVAAVTAASPMGRRAPPPR